MTTSHPAENLRECLLALDSREYFNGGQTVRLRYPRGSEERARIVAEAAFWQGQIAAIHADQGDRDQ